jgi:hypothetical protein
VVRDFRFHTGEVLPELRLHYTTVGAPTGDLPLLIQVLHMLLLGALFHIDSASFRLHPGSFAVKISDRP